MIHTLLLLTLAASTSGQAGPLNPAPPANPRTVPTYSVRQQRKAQVAPQPIDLSHDLAYPASDPSPDDGHHGGLATTARQTASCRNGTITKEVEVAIAFDHTFCEVYGNEQASLSAVRKAFAEAAKPYADQTCLRLKIQSIDAHCEKKSDPYRNLGKLEQAQVLDKFGITWLRSHDEVRHDIAILLLGFELPDSGSAWYGGACTQSVSFAWISRSAGVAALQPIVIAHEIGHLLKADHVSEGLMRFGWYPGQPLEFSDESVEEIADFVDGSSASCLSEIEDVKPPSSIEVQQGTDERRREDTPAVVAPPVRSQNSCWAAFTALGAMACARVQATVTARVDGRAIGTVQVVVRQRSGSFQLRLLGSKGVHMAAVSYLLSFQRGLQQEDVSPLQPFGRRSRRVVRSWEAADLERPDSGSCCGKPVFVYVFASLCDSVGRLCSQQFFTMSFSVRCVTCSGAFLPMDRARRCPKCRGRK